MTPRDPTFHIARSSALAATREDSHRSGLLSGGPLSGGLLSGALLGSVLAAALLGLLWAAPGELLDAIARGATWLRDHEDTATRLGASIVVVALVAFSFVAAWSRATSPSRPVRLPGGRGTIAVSEVAAWLSDALEARDDIRKATVRVECAARGVRVAARIMVTPDARLQETADAACTIIKRLVALNVGVALAEAPHIDLRYEELVLRPRRTAND